MSHTDRKSVLDVHGALDREVDQLARRFPDIDRENIDKQVRDVYAALAVHATIRLHLVTLTAARVGNMLRQRRADARLGEHVDEAGT